MFICVGMANAVNDCLIAVAKAVVVLVFPDSYSATFAREAVRARTFALTHARTRRTLHNRACTPCLALPQAGRSKLTLVPLLVSVCVCLFVCPFVFLYLGATVQQRNVTTLHFIALFDCNAGTKHRHLLSCCRSCCDGAALIQLTRVAGLYRRSSSAATVSRPRDVAAAMLRRCVC